jgi:hypothetical protein
MLRTRKRLVSALEWRTLSRHVGLRLGNGEARWRMMCADEVRNV